MSDIHVLTGSRRGGTVSTRVAFHYAIPGIDQVVNAAQDPNLVAFVSTVPDIGGPEAASIEAGEVVEVTASIRHHFTEGDAAVLAQARAEFTAGESKAVNDYKARYWEYLEAYAES